MYHVHYIPYATRNPHNMFKRVNNNVRECGLLLPSPAAPWAFASLLTMSHSKLREEIIADAGARSTKRDLEHIVTTTFTHILWIQYSFEILVLLRRSCPSSPRP
jgi:hypothetical protein